MVQVIEIPKEEKIKMYSKIPKSKLIEMLIEANRHIENRPITVRSVIVEMSEFNNQGNYSILKPIKR